MTADIKATRREFGNRQIIPVTLRVPDKVGEAFKDYNLEIIDYPNKTTTVIFLCKDDEDIDSVNFKNTNNNFVDAIKRLYERNKK